MSAWAGRLWDNLTWCGWPVMTRGRAERQAKAAFRLGVDAGAGGLLNDSSEVSRVRHLPGMPSGVVGVEIPPGH